MAIILSNGVTVPDIPADVLAQYPYTIIIYGVNSKMSVLMVSQDVFGHFDGKLIGDMGAYYVGSLAAGKWYAYREDTMAEWSSPEDAAALKNMMPVTMTERLVWANHDIYNITSININNGTYTTDGIYFLDSTVPVPELLAAPGQWFKNLANLIRMKLGVTLRFTANDMLSILDMMPSGVRGTTKIYGFASANDGKGTYFKNMLYMSFGTVADYCVVYWDDMEYKLQRQIVSDDDGASFYALGNLALVVGIEGEDTGEPFCIVWVDDEEIESMTSFYTNSSENFHTFAISNLL